MSSMKEKLTGFVEALSGKTDLPKSFRNTLRDYGDATISKVEINRQPIGSAAEWLMKLVTAGKWAEIRKNYDKIYHLYMCLTTSKGKLMLEKNQTPILYPGCPARGKDNESIVVDVPNITVNEWVKTAIEKVGLPTYTRYSGLKENCQAFTRLHMQANDLLTPDIDKFVYQDTQELIENTPSFSQRLGNLVTDVAGYADRVYQELAYKRGTFAVQRAPQRFIR